MLVLFETAAGYAIFKLLDEKKLKHADNLYESFESPEAANQLLTLKYFKKFKDTTEALAATTAAVEGKMGKSLKKLLKKLVDSETQEKLAVADAKLGNAIKEKLNIPCVSNSAIQELMRCIRSQTDSLISGLPARERAAMSLGLAHSLSRYKLKFSPDKVDTMIIQAISLLDDLDKELNNYAMRAREWYGWHFPELGKIISDNLAFANVVRVMGDRTNAVTTDLRSYLPEEVETEVREAAEISMGTEISEEDLTNIKYLCIQLAEITQYRTELYEYLKNRMLAIAPNLTTLVGELVGARLISHAGSLMNLAKQPASTVQILGAEKALFRALKTKHDTPKYGLIYHASLVGSTTPKNRGKISRMLAAKCSLAIRVDALGEDDNVTIGIEQRAKLEARLRVIEEGSNRRISGTGKSGARFERYENRSEIKTYMPEADSTLPSVPKKRKLDNGDMNDAKKIKMEVKEEPEEDGDACLSEKKKKKDKKRKSESEVVVVKEETVTPKQKKKDKKRKSAGVTPEVVVKEETVTPKQKKKRKSKGASEDADTSLDASSAAGTPATGEKKKKKKKTKA